VGSGGIGTLSPCDSHDTDVAVRLLDEITRDAGGRLSFA